MCYKVYKYKCCFHLGSAAVVVALFCFAVVKDRPGSETVNQGKNDKKKGTCEFFSTECLYRYIYIPFESDIWNFIHLHCALKTIRANH